MEQAGSRDVLVVESERARREDICRALVTAGFRPVATASPGEAVEALARGRFGLAFVAVRHLGHSGFEVAERLRSISPSLGVVFVSSSEYADDAVQAMRFGACEFIRTPIDPTELRLAVSRIRERASLADFAFQANLRYDHLVQNIPLIIFSLREDMGLDFINRACLPMLGYTPDEAMSSPGFLASRLHPDDQDRILSTFREGLDHHAPFTVQTRLLHRQGGVVHAIVKSMPRFAFSGQEGTPTVDGVILDISERIILEKTLIQDEKLKMLGTISAEVAHEIRNPLVAIGGFARRLKLLLPQNEDIDIILREAARLENLLTRIRGYLRPLRVSPRPVSIERVLADALHLVSQEFAERGASCRRELASGLPQVLVDPDVLVRVMASLFLHCLQHLPHAVEVELRAEADGPGVRVELAAPARPSPLDSPDRAFLPFDAQEEQFGLPLCHRLVKSMGGVFTFDVIGERSVYIVSLPSEKAAADSVVYDLVEPAPWPGTGTAGDGAVADSDFDALFSREWRRAGRHHVPLCVIMVDVDDFQAFAARHGVKTARSTLSTVADVIADKLKRPGDFLDSGGGQQFTAVLPDTDELGGVIVAEEIREAVAALALQNEDSPFGRITVSVGVASTVPGQNAERSKLIEDAAHELFVAKGKGKNRVQASRLRR